MKILRTMLLFAAAFASLAACKPTQLSSGFGKDISIRWEHLGNYSASGKQCRVKFIFANNGKETFKSGNWHLYFSAVPLKPLASETPEIGKVEHVNGDFFRFAPGEKFEIKPGEKLEFTYSLSGGIINYNQPPIGLFFVNNVGKPDYETSPVSDYLVIPFTRVEQMTRTPNDLFPLATPEFCYQQNQLITNLPVSELQKIVPAPVNISELSGKTEITADYSIAFDKEFKNEALFLQKILSSCLGKTPKISEGANSGKNIICLKKNKVNVEGVAGEAYSLQTKAENGICIEAPASAGIFYGIQSLMALFPPKCFKESSAKIEIPAMDVKDAPRFAYRGIMLDVSRHFHPKADVMKMIDIIAFYKLNKLQLLLSDDEGWRLEIPGLPELTEVGSVYGYSPNKWDFVQPAYGAGASANSPGHYGSGHFTRADYIELLKYAAQRHITIVPEFCVPGHARAAIVSMENRYEKLMKQGKKDAALEYRLRDPEDTSKYSSAQSYHDNVVCIGLESVYHFYEKVVSEVKKMYDEAGVPFEWFHTGGDEVPNGVWLGSPACKNLVASSAVKNPLALQSKFTKRIADMLQKYKVNIAGWEEVALLKNEERRLIPNPELTGKTVAYIWNNLWGSQDLGYRVANAGNKVVLCNVSNFYFDLAYQKHPEERGLNWGGYVSTREAFEFIPFDMFKSTHYNDGSGSPFTEKDAAKMEKLTPAGKANILGLQAELWSETLTKPGLIDYYTLPKLVGFSESCWAKERSWETIADEKARKAAIDAAWNQLANVIGVREFKRLDYLFGGYTYRIPPAGAVIKDGTLYANTEHPGLTIRYTTDGSEPTDKSPVYKDPVKISGTAKLKVFNDLGRSGRTITVKADL
jgi:hexosaminidase